MPARTPTRLKILNGSAAHDPQRINRREPQPRSRRPAMPADMTTEAKAIWRHVMAEMAATGVITGADRDILRLYCEAVARTNKVTALLAGSGPLIRGARGGELVKNPLNQLAKDGAVLVLALANRLGLTPAARSGLSGSAAPERDPFADFLDGIN